MKTIDACGVSCPEPLLRLKSALKNGEPFTLLVDSKNALDNCVDYAKKQGYQVSVENCDGVYNISINKS